MSNRLNIYYMDFPEYNRTGLILIRFARETYVTVQVSLYTYTRQLIYGFILRV